MAKNLSGRRMIEWGRVYKHFDSSTQTEFRIVPRRVYFDTCLRRRTFPNRHRARPGAEGQVGSGGWSVPARISDFRSFEARVAQLRHTVLVLLGIRPTHRSPERPRNV